jgi:signal recognition particle GTPase
VNATSDLPSKYRGKRSIVVVELDVPQSKCEQGSVLARIRDKPVGVEVSKALDPAQQVVKIVHVELIGFLGGETLKITYASESLK